MTTSVARAFDDPETVEEYCARTASEHCFATQGYTSLECEEQYYTVCVSGAGGGSNSPPPPWFDPGVPVRDCTYQYCWPHWQ